MSNRWSFGDVRVEQLGRTGQGHIMVLPVIKPRKSKTKPVFVKSNATGRDSELLYGDFGTVKANFTAVTVQNFRAAVMLSEPLPSMPAAKAGCEEHPAQAATSSATVTRSKQKPPAPDSTISLMKYEAAQRMSRFLQKMGGPQLSKAIGLVRARRAKKFKVTRQMLLRLPAFPTTEGVEEGRLAARLEALKVANWKRQDGITALEQALKRNRGENKVHALIRVACSQSESFTPEKCSPHALTRVQQQASAMLFVMKKLVARDSIELNGEVPLVLKADDIMAQAAEAYHVCARTIWRWKTDFEKDHSFAPDARGTYDRNLIIDQEDIRLRFQEFMKGAVAKRKLSIRIASVYVNTNLLPSLPFGMLAKHGVQLPVCDETVRVWMHRCDAVCEIYKLGYYNDKHGCIEVIEFRIKYTADMLQLEKRQPLYLHFTAADITRMFLRAAARRAAADDADAPELTRPPKGEHVGTDAAGERVFEYHVDAWDEFDFERMHFSGLHNTGASLSAHVQTPAVVAEPAFTPVPMMAPQVRDCDHLLGRRLQKKFGGDMFGGCVTGVYVSKGHTMYSCLYDDGDPEDYDRGELDELLLPAVPHKSACGSFEQQLFHLWHCSEGHKYTNCKCHLPLIGFGQDESIFKSNCLQAIHWVVCQMAGLRRKGEGVGLHVSAITGAMGFGFQLGYSQLNTVNIYRRAKYGVDMVKDLAESPGIIFLDYGKNKQGYWNWERLSEQLRDLIDCFDALFPDCQMLMEVDWSQGHASFPPDALKVSSVNAKFGGKQTAMHPSTLGPGDVGPHEFKVWLKADGAMCETREDLEHSGSHEEDMRLYSGMVQSFVFEEGDLPPFYAKETPKYDVIEKVVVTKAMRAAHRKKFDKRVVKVGVTAAGEFVDLPSHVEKVTEGYVGKPKGARQLLMERGLLDDSTSIKYVMRDNDHPDRSLWHILGACSDFQEEMSAMCKMFADAGHICRFSPKGHPELAGRGVEYCWGTAKVKFRLINDCVAANLREHVTNALRSVTVRLARQHERKARSYRNAYANPDAPENKDAVEKLVRLSKAHRCTLDQDYAYVCKSLKMEPDAVSAVKRNRVEVELDGSGSESEE